MLPTVRLLCENIEGLADIPWQEFLFNRHILNAEDVCMTGILELK